MSRKFKKQPKKQKTEAQILVQKYDALSPMMKIIFSSEAQLRNAVDQSLMPVLSDLTQADRLVNDLLKFPYNNPAQARSLIVHVVSPLVREDKILNYATNALVIGDAIVYRMAYAYGQLYQSMKDFSVVHPILTDSQELQRQIAFLKRMNRTAFSMKNPACSKYYKDWAASTPEGRGFNQRRENYTLALTSVLKEMGITFKQVPLPYTGVGRAFIKEKARERS